jgi:hypothetical protein
MTITVRAAAERDMDWLMQSSSAFDRFAGYKRSLIEDDAYARAALKVSSTQHVCFIAEDASLAGSPLYEAARALASSPATRRRTFQPAHPRAQRESFWWVSARAPRTARPRRCSMSSRPTAGATATGSIMTLEQHSPVNPRHLTQARLLAARAVLSLGGLIMGSTGDIVRATLAVASVGTSTGRAGLGAKRARTRIDDAQGAPTRKRGRRAEARGRRARRRTPRLRRTNEEGAATAATDARRARAAQARQGAARRAGAPRS